MLKYLKAHEDYIIQTLKSDSNHFDWAGLLEYHKTKTGFLQHERLVHLLVTLAFGLFLLVSIYFTIINENQEIIFLDILFLLLTIPYIFHYYRLEKGVQRMYDLFNLISNRIHPSK
jgi:hypothetical protein